MQTITLKKTNNVVIYNNDKDLTLKAGAILKPACPSLDKALIALRDANTTTDSNGNLITTTDLNFKSKSALASFIQGGATNGNRYFEKYLGNAQAQPNPQPTTNSSNSNTTNSNPQPQTQAQPKVAKANKLSDAEIKDKLAKNILCFCKDFEFKPDNRCLNTMFYVDDVNDYIKSFMELVNYPQDLIDNANAKMKSAEWNQYMETLKGLTPSRKPINNRLIIKYGSRGTGKTQDAHRQYPNAKTIIASASADPDDLFTTFNPTTKGYDLTELAKAMENGEPIIIDEANLYNAVVLQRLQGITDEIEQINDRGIDIHIKDGFKIIITMNLETNLGKTPLPDPLVSRAEKIENYDSRANVDLSWVW